jgi:probable rRNA maturation factor
MELIVRTRPLAATTPPPPHLDLARTAAAQLVREAGRPDAEISLLFVDDAAIRALNRDWRGQDKPTDVLSWPQQAAQQPDSDQEPGRPLDTEDTLGDVVISLDTADQQARARGWTLEEEVALLLVHGILHLLGHEDETEAGARAMRHVERRILGRPLEKTRSLVAKTVE